MSGYVASARITRGSARPARSPDLRFTPAELIEPASAGASLIDTTPAADAPSGAVAVRWSALRERWSQLTFFLFDSNSWRT
jgi:hypothetical protein